MTCECCGEDITLADEPARQIGVVDSKGKGRVGFMHRECGLREAMGGIGHCIAHDYWCLQMHDPDAGLTYHQSAKLVWTYYNVVGIPPP